MKSASSMNGTIELKPLYDVALIEREGRHYYSVDNNPTLYPGVTTVLGIISKPYLVPWAAKICGEHTKRMLGKIATKRPLTDRFIETLYRRSKIQWRIYRDRASDIGSRAHNVFDAIVKGYDYSVDKDILTCVEGFRRWIGSKSFQIELGDTKIADTELGYGGSLDALARSTQGEIVIIDYKTSNSISDEYALQVAAYSNAFAKTFGLTYLPQAYIIRFGKGKPVIEVAKIRDINESFEAFKNALSLYKGYQQEFYSEKTLFKPEKKLKIKKELSK